MRRGALCPAKSPGKISTGTPFPANSMRSHSMVGMNKKSQLCVTSMKTAVLWVALLAHARNGRASSSTKPIILTPHYSGQDNVVVFGSLSSRNRRDEKKKSASSTPCKPSKLSRTLQTMTVRLKHGYILIEKRK